MDDPASPQSPGSSPEPCYILRLPLEILSQIFTQLAPDPFPPWSLSKPNYDVRPVRLTCRAFNHASSHLLIDRVVVSLNETTLRRLEAIAGHPRIGRGVRTVRISLQMYDSRIADCIHTFRSSRATLSHEIRKYQFKTVCAAIKGTENPPRPTSWYISTVSQDQQAMYRRRYQDQEELLANGSFYHRLVAALNQMPRVTALRIDDGPEFQVDKLHEYRKNNTPFGLKFNELDAYLCPSMWRDLAPEKVPIELFRGILVALGRDTSIRLRSLDVQISRTSSIVSMGPQKQDYDAVKQLLCRLENFRLGCVTGQVHKSTSFTNDFTHETEASATAESICKLLDMPMKTLRTIELDFSGVEHEESRAELPLGRILKSSAASRITSLTLHSVRFHESDIKEFVRRRKVPGLLLTLDHAILGRGTWERVLDHLRGAVGGGNIDSPEKGECTVYDQSSIRHVFDPFAGQEDLKPVHGDVSRAMAYVMGLDETNPLRSLRTLGKDNGTDIEYIYV